MSSSKASSRSSTLKRDGSFRYATRLLALEKGRRSNNTKESNAMKACECLLKSEGWKGSKHLQNSRFPIKKVSSNKSLVKDGKNKVPSSNREKVVIVSKRSSSVSVVKSCSLRKSVSVKKVSYSTSVVLSSDEDSDSEEESDDDDKEEYSSRKKTILKHTTSKVKSRYSPPKKSELRAAKKAKAIKLLCDKLSSTNKQKSLSPIRELRPRFPYTVMQEWPTARAHRMASLNALAKVHVLYENEGKITDGNLKDADECSLIDFLNEENTDDESDDKKESKPLVKKSENQTNSSKKNENQNNFTKKNENHSNSFKKNDTHSLVSKKTDIYSLASKKNENQNGSTRKNDKNRGSDSEKPKHERKKIVRRSKKRKFSDVEIIDTRICKRMASLNAQAILAASYLQEPKEPKPKRIARKVEEKSESSSDIDVKEIFLESKCDVEIIETEKKGKSSILKDSVQVSDEDKSENVSNSDPKDKRQKNGSSTSPDAYNKNWSVESGEIPATETQQNDCTPHKDESDTIVSTAATKVGLTQYTEVTKVHINTRKDVEIKEESKSERKIERILANDDVAITQMYHYQSKNANESYCLQMQTTYKPASKSHTPSTLPMAPSSPMHPHINEPVIPGRQNYYSHSPMLPPQPYHMNPNVGNIPSVIGMDHHIPRQYGASAFTVPHYRHPHQMQFPQNDYGYYQPAGPLIQPPHDQYTIHKPVPYHPQPQPHLHQPPQRPQLPVSNRDRYRPVENNQVHQNNSSNLPHHHASVPHPQSSIPSATEATPPPSQPSMPPYKRHHPMEGPHERNINNVNTATYSNSKQIPPSRQGSYLPHNNNNNSSHLQKPVSYGNYQQPYEQTIHHPKPGPTSSTSDFKNRMNPLHSHTAPLESDIAQENARHATLGRAHQNPHIAENYKNIHQGFKNPPWEMKTHHDTIYNAPVYFSPYQSERDKEMPPVNMQDNVRYPLRPPSVIEITEDSSRDTKTYIQLEVPKNSHREKIVVVDVENDEIDKKCDPPQPSESNNLSPILVEEESAAKKPEISVKSEVNKQDKISVKSEVKSPEPCAMEQEINTVENISVDEDKALPKKTDDDKDMPDIMVIEVKKKKESAVVRRARLQGKQRTFRDCYNRPLAQLSKLKKVDNSNTAGNHMKKNFQPLVSLPRLVLPKASERRTIHGWSWEGNCFEKQVYISNDDLPCIRRCYLSIRHAEGDVVSVKDCVFLRSGPRKTDLPFVAKITALWENPADGEMTMSLLWYYRPEHTETEKKFCHMDDEIFASKHRDMNSVACIEDKCYVLTYLEYCRYRKKIKLAEDNIIPPPSVVPEVEDYPRKKRLPPVNISPDLVLFCRKVYDYRQKRLLKNPT